MMTGLEGLEGICVVADDVLVYGKGDDEEEAQRDHDENLKKLLERCRKINLKLNKEKFQHNKVEIDYIGHKIS